MLRSMKHKHYTKLGFTIVELLIVIVVIGILAAISIVAYSGAQDKARISVTKAEIAAIEKGVRLYHTDHNAFPTSLADMKDSGYFDVTEKMSWG